MNYMQAVEFTAIGQDRIRSQVYYQKRELIFTFPFDRIQVVPFYMIHEAIFQTAGRFVRILTNNTKGGIVASFRDFKFLRPLLPNEMISIEAICMKNNEDSAFFRIQVSVENEIILEKGSLILLLTEAILSPHLNNQMPKENEGLIHYLKKGALSDASIH